MTKISKNISAKNLMHKALVLTLASIFAFACGANDSILKSGKQTPAPSNSTPELSTLEQDINEMRTADFQFIYVLRRKDGAVMDSEDKSVIKLQTYQANRRVSSDNGKAVVVGSNTQIAPDKMLAVLERFAVENFTK